MLLENYMYSIVGVYIKRPFFLSKKVEIVEFLKGDIKLLCYCFGEYYENYGNKHNDVPKVKNPNFANMRICNEPEKNRFEIFVTIDPSNPRASFYEQTSS